MNARIDAGEETGISEVSIAPDGRVFVFGTSRQLLEMFADLGLADESWQRRLCAMAKADRSDTPARSLDETMAQQSTEHLSDIRNTEE